ncbi:hypothetical protein [Phenylobacterium sp.]|jgi:hypothetical protein|uniref:hypothetical protein n=1 Tax=Phenylobacterium sp. TaxID=1871053 RepID=UPI002E361983|nr:hypothetical protein [Phenylobacterium sp.]HEX2560721.1 hypothetical protein [Phenylobacterium sp.]
MSTEPEAHNVAQLKDDIDSGRTGDKVGGFDPGAAPLGTDEEAGGASLTSEEVALARAQEGGRSSGGANHNAAEPSLQPTGAGDSGPRVGPALIGAAVGALLVIGALVLLL